jgi:putative Mg2+ transporter-C (MgtC) family protein
MVVSLSEFILRILLAAFLGALIGYERERRNQPAGLRTQMILAVGSALSMILSINLAYQFTPNSQAGDPARLAAQVVSGIGFLGAGAILHYGANVKGLTTATSLWTIAIIGLSVGAGHYLFGTATALMILLILVVLARLEHRFVIHQIDLNLTIEAEDRHGLINEIKSHLGASQFAISTTQVSKNLETNHIIVCLEVRSIQQNIHDELIGRLSKIEGVKNFKVA